MVRSGAIPAAVRARYDLVSFDPRGVGKSRPVECLDGATTDALYDEDPTPDTPDELYGYADTSESEIHMRVGQCNTLRRLAGEDIFSWSRVTICAALPLSASNRARRSCSARAAAGFRWRPRSGRPARGR